MRSKLEKVFGTTSAPSQGRGCRDVNEIMSSLVTYSFYGDHSRHHRRSHTLRCCLLRTRYGVTTRNKSERLVPRRYERSPPRRVVENTLVARWVCIYPAHSEEKSLVKWPVLRRSQAHANQ